MSKPSHVIVSRAEIDSAVEQLPNHLHPILYAVRDHGVGMMFIPQGREAFRLLEGGRSTVLIVGDDLDAARGPGSFHTSSLRQAIRQCDGFAVVSSAPPMDVYAATALAAALGLNMMIVETQPAQEIQWSNLIRELAPGCPFILSTVEGGHA